MRLAGTLPARPDVPPAGEMLARIRRWQAGQNEGVTGAQALKQRVAGEIAPYLGNRASSAVLQRVTGEGENLLSVVETVLAAFLGRSAAAPLVNHVVDRAIMRI